MSQEWLEIIENAKFYKNIAERRIANFSEVIGALQVVAKFVKDHRRVLYGGMAIDFALKLHGHKGIYAEDTVPDYDFYSSCNIYDSVLIATILDENYKKVNCINAMHLTTRRVRINSTNYVADVSYFPEPYFSRIPTLNYKGFLIVHPDFQRADMHRALSYLYEGAPARESFRNRLNKDVARLNLLYENIPLSKHIIDPLPQQDLLMNNFGRPCEINDVILTKIANLPTQVCIVGFAALHLMSKSKNKSYKSPDYLEIMSDFPEQTMQELDGGKWDIYEKTGDIFPEAAVNHKLKIIVYNNFGERVSAETIKFANKNIIIANVHYLCTTFLFKHFMLDGYIEYYEKCIEIIKSITSVTGNFYGCDNIYEPYVISERQENCNLQKLPYDPRPIIGLDKNNKKLLEQAKNFKCEDFETYQVAGRRRKHFSNKNTDCELKK